MTATPDDYVPPALGVHDLPDAEYHRDFTSMSSTTARHILRPGCPARVEWEMHHPKVKDEFDLGTVTHHLILGKGPEIVEVQLDNWMTKAAKEARAEARERGAVAILTKDLVRVREMVAAVRRHPRAAKLLTEGTGIPERSVFWLDEETGIRRRAMLDWFPTREGKGQPVAVDVKTTTDASPEAIMRAVMKWGYHQQDPFYRDGLIAADFPDAAFAFVFVEKEPPYLVTVVQLDDTAIEVGWRRNRRAIEQWDMCQRTGVWPDYGTDIHTIGLPAWAMASLELEESL